MRDRARSHRRKKDPAPIEPASNEGAPPAATPLADSAEAPPPNKPTKPPKGKRKRRKGAGRRPLPLDLPTIRQTFEVCACGHCGSQDLLARDVEEAVRLDVVERAARLRQELREVVRCKRCGKTTTAEGPSLPCERSKFTCAFLAWLVTMRFQALVPINRIRKLLSSQGIDLAKSTLIRCYELASSLCDAVDGEHWKKLLAEKCLHTDGTGLKVRIEGLDQTWPAVLDVFTNGEVSVYQFVLTKHGDLLASLLQKFKGVLLCDAESRLNEISAAEGVRRANCNAHPRRAFRDAESAQPVLAKEAGRYYTQMYAIERAMAREGISGEERLRRRQRDTRPIADAFFAYLNRHKDLLPTDPLGKVVRYCLNHWEGLTRFIDDPAVPIDNNTSERAVQDHARLRFNSLFAGSPEGGHRWAVLLGVVTTARRLGLDVQAYLTWMFERRGTRKDAFGLTAGQLTPAAYQLMRKEQDQERVAA